MKSSIWTVFNVILGERCCRDQEIAECVLRLFEGEGTNVGRKGTNPKKPNNFLRMERKNRGWSQARLAELIGADTSMISRWECGERSPEPAYQEKLCTLFAMKASELGFIEDAPISHSLVDISTHILPPREYVRFANSFPSTSKPSNTGLLKSIIDRNFSNEILYDLLSLNIKTMNFREEWQYVVNNLVAEAQVSLRAMVFDTELTRWWNTLAGQIYMMTNMDLLKRKVSVKRIFILSSIDTRLRMNTLMNAYVHHKIGIDVRVCKVTDFQENIPFKPDMFSVHDNLFVALYYFSYEKPLTNLLLEDKYISEFSSFYDELFMDDRLCADIETVLAHTNYGESFFASIQIQMELLQRLRKIGSITDLTRML